MFKWIVLLIAMMPQVGFTQLVQNPGSVRFRDEIYNKVRVLKNIRYTGDSSTENTSKRALFDLYEAATNDSTARPLVIWMHGGGFKFGSKRSKAIRIWSNSFAKRGYVSVAINYPLSKRNTLRNFNELVKACYITVNNLHIVIEYFKRHSSKYGIDTGKIIVAGNSAGAITALHAAYARNSDFHTKITDHEIDTTFIRFGSQNIAAVINFWGAVFDTSWLNNTKIPIVSVHGKRDRVVPYTTNGTSLFGSFLIHRKAVAAGIPSNLKTYEKFGHELQKHFIPILRSRPTKKRWRDAGTFAAVFLAETLFR